MSEEISHIGESEVAGIARTVFGSSAVVDSVKEIRPSEGENPRIVGCNWNLSYIVSITGHEGSYVFRFNRRRYGRDDASILDEQEHNALIAARSPIPVPRIRYVDVSRTIVPTGFMVMDFMPGDSWRYLTHPGNAATSVAEKKEIATALGRATAQLHCITQPSSGEPGAGIVVGLDALERVVADSNCLVTPERIEACRRIARSDPVMVLDEESFCIGDGDMHLVRGEGGWEISFLCDLEYQGYGDPYHDIAPLLCHPAPLWGLTEPISVASPGPLIEPYFQGYEQVRPIDRERLSTMAVYAHLGLKCGGAREAYKADEGPGIEEREPPIYPALLREIEKRGEMLGLV